MHIWAIADIHLSFGVKNKEMDVFGDCWKDHPQKIEKHWKELIHPEDLVLIPGDISWAMHLEEAIPDLRWIDSLPGTKVLIRGNHDLWWKSAAKIRAVLPPSLHIIHNDAFSYNGVAIGGTRLWDHPAFNFNPYINFRETPGVNVHGKENTPEERAHDEKIFNSELSRLAWSLDAMDKGAQTSIVMVHHPPTGPEHQDSPVTRLMETAEVDFVLYGHLHSLKKDAPVNFTKGRTQYLFTAADYLDFKPLKIL